MKKSSNIVLGILTLIFLINGFMGAGRTEPITSFSDTTQGESQTYIFIGVVLGVIWLIRISGSEWANKDQSKNAWKNTATVANTKKTLRRTKK